MRLLICGDREWTDAVLIAEFLDSLQERPTVIMEGGQRGTDAIARAAAVSRNIPVETYDADWAEFGKAAGPLRNKRMLEVGRPDWVVVFHDHLSKSRGTANVLAQARKVGLPTVVVSHTSGPVVVVPTGGLLSKPCNIAGWWRKE